MTLMMTAEHHYRSTVQSRRQSPRPSLFFRRGGLVSSPNISSGGRGTPYPHHTPSSQTSLLDPRLRLPRIPARSTPTGGSKGGREGPWPPSPCGPFANKLGFLCINHNVVSNTLVLPPRAICIHTTASFPTSNGFWRLKRFKQSMEE